MKLQKLIIHNIASIVDATIEFDQPPLSNSDVYLITGDTGAGKTTILDSICLALFNNTPRMTKGKDTSVQNDLDNLTLKDPRRLMRLRTGEAWVVLYFESNGAEYMAEWQVQRGKRKKTDTQMSPTNRRLVNMATGEEMNSVGTKDKDLQDKIKEIIGLDFDQFCRTTMLAQNEFTKFLASDDKERAAILEKITKTTVFSEVGSKVYEITTQKENAWKDAQKAASNTGLSKDEVEQKKKEIVELEDQSKTKTKERDLAKTKKDWLEGEAKLAKGENDAEAAYNKASEPIESEKFKEALDFVKQWNETIEARQWLTKRHEAERTVEGLKEKLKGLQTEFVRVLGGVGFEEERLKGIEEELGQINDYMEANKDKVATFENAQTILAHLKTIIDKNKNIENNNKEIKAFEKELKETLEPQQEKDKESAEKAGKAVGDVVTEIDDKKKELAKVDLTKLRGERDTLKDLLRDIEQAIGHVKDIGEKVKAHEDERKRIEGIQKGIEQQEKDLKEKLEPKYTNAKDKRDAAKESRDLMLNSVDKFAKGMRTHLKVGCECPVCRQKVEKLPLEAELDELYKAANEYFEKCESDFTTAEGAKNAADSDIKSAKERYEEDKKKFDEDRSVADAEEKALESCRKCGIETLSERTIDDLNELHDRKNRYLVDTLEPEIKRGEDIEKKLSELNDKWKELNNDWDDKKKIYQGSIDNVKDRNTKIEGRKENIKSDEKEKNEASECVEGLVVEAGWQHDWKKEPELYRDELQSASNEYNKKKSRKETLEKDEGPLQGNVKNVGDIVNQIREKNEAWKELVPTVLLKQEELLTMATGVLEKVGSNISSTETAQKTIGEMSGYLDSYVRESGIGIERLEELNRRVSVSVLSGSLDNLLQTQRDKKTLWEKAVEEHKKHQEEKPELTTEETLEVVKEAYQDADKGVNDLNREIGAIGKELADDEKLKQGVDALLEIEHAAKAEYEKWDRLNKLIGDSSGSKFRTIAQSYIFDGLLHSANAYLQKLEPRYTLKTVEGTLFSSLEDAYQGYSSRDTGSLSGGESFLVSLALALALSDIGQGLSVDTLFIDEGFGSLSGQPLANAINTLRSLHHKNGRHVGIISHIQEVRDNIPVQIQVNKSAISSSSTVEVVEGV